MPEAAGFLGGRASDVGTHSPTQLTVAARCRRREVGTPHWTARSVHPSPGHTHFTPRTNAGTGRLPLLVLGPSDCPTCVVRGRCHPQPARLPACRAPKIGSRNLPRLPKTLPKTQPGPRTCRLRAACALSHFLLPILQPQLASLDSLRHNASVAVHLAEGSGPPRSGEGAGWTPRSSSERHQRNGRGIGLPRTSWRACRMGPVRTRVTHRPGRQA
jgi:hypothetical protein